MRFYINMRDVPCLYCSTCSCVPLMCDLRVAMVILKLIRRQFDFSNFQMYKEDYLHVSLLSNNPIIPSAAHKIQRAPRKKYITWMFLSESVCLCVRVFIFFKILIGAREGGHHKVVEKPVCSKEGNILRWKELIDSKTEKIIHPKIKTLQNIYI